MIGLIPVVGKAESSLFRYKPLVSTCGGIREVVILFS